MVDEVARQTEVRKVNVKTKTVNQEVVEERRRCALPREILRTVKPRRFKTDMVKPVEKGLPQEVS